jgi:hypothetical protein
LPGQLALSASTLHSGRSLQHRWLAGLRIERGGISEIADLEEAARALASSLETFSAGLDQVEAQASAGFRQTGQPAYDAFWRDAHSGAGGVPGVPDEVVDAVRRGKTVGAITRHRDVMGTTGKEATAAVESLEKHLRGSILPAAK